MSDLLLPGVICLTDQKPIQCKDIVRASEATADLLPNYTDLRFPYKGSSMLCPTCGKPLAGTPREDEKVEEEPEDPKETKGKKGKAPKRKPKPWEIHVENLQHEKTEDQENCPANLWKEHPHARLMALVASAHQITWIRAWKEQASRPEGTIGKADILENLEKDGTLPKLTTTADPESDNGDEHTLI